MSVNYLENNKKYIIASILGLGVSTGLYYVWDVILKVKYALQLTNEPNNEELERAWEGFYYDPQNLNAYQIKQVFQRSLKLYFKVIQYGSLIMRQARRKNYQNQIVQLSDIVDEIMSKDYINEKMTKLFLQFKNHSYQEFLAAINSQKNNNLQISKLNQRQIELTYYCTDPFKSQLFSINQFYYYLKMLVPILNEIKPQLDRALRFIEQNNFHKYQQLIVILHLEDIIFLRLQFEFSIFTMTLDNLQDDKIPLKIKEDLKNQLLVLSNFMKQYSD